MPLRGEERRGRAADDAAPPIPAALRFEALRRERLFAEPSGAGAGQYPGAGSGVRERAAQGTRDLSPLTLIHAPAGYGKTVAAVHRAEDLRARGVDVRWISAREYADAAERLIDELAEMARALESPAVVFIDDYEEATNVETDLALAQLLSLGDRLSLVIASRRLAALDGPVVSGRVATVRITEAELRFTDAETASLAETASTGRVDLVSRLQSFCDGWPLPVAGVIREFKPQMRSSALLELAASYAHQMFELLPSDRLRRVLLAAIAGDFATPAHLARLTGISEKECIADLLALEAHGLVRRTWYSDGLRIVGHPGVREPLEDRARSEFGQAALRRWQIENARAVNLVEPEAAFTRLLRCEAYEEAEAVLSAHFLELSEGRNAQLLHQLRGAPYDRLVDYPVFIAARLQLEQADPDSDPAVVKQLFDDMKARVSEQLVDGSVRNLAAEIVSLGMLSVGERMRGSGESLMLARELQRRLDANRGGALIPLSRTLPYVYAVAAYGGLVNGDLELSERGFASALEVSEELGDIDEMLRGFYGLAATAALAGRIFDAERILDRAREHAERTGAAAPQLSWMNGTLAELLIAIERLDADGFEEAMRRIRPMLDRAEAWPHFLIAENTMERLLHGRFRAFDMMERRRSEVEKIFVTVPFTRISLESGIATMHMLAGDYRAAAHELAKLPSGHPLVMNAMVRLELLAGSPEAALETARRAADRASAPRALVNALLLRAVVEWQSGDRDAAIASGSRLADTMTEHGFWSGIGLVPHSHIEAVADALAERGDARLAEFVARVPDIARFEPYEQLSQAEARIVSVLAEHETVGELAERLFLSPNTVKTHLKQVYRKLRVSKRAEAIERAAQIGLIPQGDSSDG